MNKEELFNETLSLMRKQKKQIIEESTHKELLDLYREVKNHEFE